MKIIKNFAARSVLGALLLSGGAYGNLVAPVSIVQLEKSADLIVTGAVDNAAQSGTSFSFSIRVSRVIKGDPSFAGTAVPTFWETGAQPPADSSAFIRGAGIWFLQRVANMWRVIPVMQGTMDFAETYFPESTGPILPAYTYSPRAPLEDKLGAEIGAAIEASPGYVPQFYIAMESGLLDELKSPVLTLLYQRLANSTSADKKLLGLSGLIREQDASAVAEAVSVASTVQGKPAEGVFLTSMRVYLRAADPSAVAALGAVAADTSNPNLELREAAAHALAAIHTAGTLPFLATLLDAADSNLQAEAVGGMGAFANGLAIQTNAGVPSLSFLQRPSSAPYRTPDTEAHLAFGQNAIAGNKNYYVSFWKQWWAENRTALGY